MHIILILYHMQYLIYQIIYLILFWWSLFIISTLSVHLYTIDCAWCTFRHRILNHFSSQFVLSNRIYGMKITCIGCLRLYLWYLVFWWLLFTVLNLSYYGVFLMTIVMKILYIVVLINPPASFNGTILSRVNHIIAYILSNMHPILYECNKWY